MSNSTHVPGLGPVDPAHPELPDVQQRPDPMLPEPVPVRHDGPMFTQELPAVLGTVSQHTIGTSPETVLSDDPFRKRATLISTDNPFIIIRGKFNNGSGVAATWPANVPFIYTATSSLSLVTAAGTANVSIITENGTR
jgi:hypothetical protein